MAHRAQARPFVAFVSRRVGCEEHVGHAFQVSGPAVGGCSISTRCSLPYIAGCFGCRQTADRPLPTDRPPTNPGGRTIVSKLFGYAWEVFAYPKRIQMSMLMILSVIHAPSHPKRINILRIQHFPGAGGSESKTYPTCGMLYPKRIPKIQSAYPKPSKTATG